MFLTLFNQYRGKIHYKDELNTATRRTMFSKSKKKIWRQYKHIRFGKFHTILICKCVSEEQSESVNLHNPLRLVQCQWSLQRTLLLRHATVKFERRTWIDASYWPVEEQVHMWLEQWVVDSKQKLAGNRSTENECQGQFAMRKSPFQLIFTIF